MTGPMVLLAVGSVVAGFLLVRGDALSHWLEPVFGEPRRPRTSSRRSSSR